MCHTWSEEWHLLMTEHFRVLCYSTHTGMYSKNTRMYCTHAHWKFEIPQWIIILMWCKYRNFTFSWNHTNHLWLLAHSVLNDHLLNKKKVPSGKRRNDPLFLSLSHSGARSHFLPLFSLSPFPYCRFPLIKSRREERRGECVRQLEGEKEAVRNCLRRREEASFLMQA